MKSTEIEALAAEFGMSERIASPFGRPHFVNDCKGAELEIIVAGNSVHASLLFSAESMSHLNRDIGRRREDWTPETLRDAVTALSEIRERRKDDAMLAEEMEDAA